MGAQGLSLFALRRLLTMRIVAASLIVLAVAVDKKCDPKRTYAQCGGFSYTGETCCPEGWGCSFVAAEYSQCTLCSEGYGQCAGGPGYNGSTCCATGWKCVSQGNYYSGCEPADG